MFKVRLEQHELARLSDWAVLFCYQMKLLLKILITIISQYAVNLGFCENICYIGKIGIYF